MNRLIAFISVILSCFIIYGQDNVEKFNIGRTDTIYYDPSNPPQVFKGGVVYQQITAATQLTDKKSGILIRYGVSDPIASKFNEYGLSITMAALDIGKANAATKTLYNSVLSKGMDLGVWSNLSGTNSAFIINNITPNNIAYYEAQDAEAALKGIDTILAYGGFDYCLQNVVYPNNPSGLGAGNYEALNFTTVEGTSDITITPTIGGYCAIYLDATKGYAVDFPAKALNKWWILRDLGTGNYKLYKNNIIPLEDYCGSAIQGSHSYTTTNQVGAIKWNQFYPNITGLNYQYQENVRTFRAYGLPDPVSFGEVEQGGYATWDSLGSDLYDALYTNGFRAGTKDPLFEIGVNQKNNDPYDRFKVIATSTTALSSGYATEALREQRIADLFSKNIFIHDRSTTGMALASLDSLIQFCQLNSIPILSYRQYASRHWEGDYDITQNIFPRANKNISNRVSTTPDGYNTLPDGVKIESTGGVDIDSLYRFSFLNTTTDSLKVTSLYGLELGDNIFSIYAKNSGLANDVVEVSIMKKGSKTDYYRKHFLFTVNNSEYIQFADTFFSNAIVKDIYIRVKTWGSSDSLHISGIEIKGVEPTELNHGYESESINLFARMDALGVEPNDQRKVIIDSTIKSLKRAEINGGIVNLWDKAIALYALASHSQASANLNWVSNNFNITPYETPVYKIDTGYVLNGTNQYLGTGFIPSNNPKWKLADASLMIFINAGGSTPVTAPDIGARPSTSNRSMIAVDYNASYGLFAINSGNMQVNALAGANTGMFGIGRLNSLYGNILIGDQTTYSQTSVGTVTNTELLLGRYTTSYLSNRYGFALIARGLSSEELIKFGEIITVKYLNKL